MKPDELGRDILKAVSRSFYLSIRVLPAGTRGPIGLAYLLARASDTIADTATAPVDERLRALACLSRAIETTDPSELAQIKEKIPSAHAGERALLAQLENCVKWLGEIEA